MDFKIFWQQQVLDLLEGEAETLPQQYILAHFSSISSVAPIASCWYNDEEVNVSIKNARL
ncbi:hypothetical protein B7O87_09590 [Cylindrospermopsis raciborskii CENA303]|uniref:Uncharacterized protein n=1 Tax=Cylindrospermopsis raciborskii CENA303 TaxID=1170769 RepID=A0A1X4G6F6_9CYAN|nr:hypothetical protein CRD_00570 [Raphidiopsis brookii D9]OSO90276.1 hypothetical protein B7O87_09590 [Cylindrospermopsis raciborskii CENA303]